MRKTNVLKTLFIIFLALSLFVFASCEFNIGTDPSSDLNEYKITLDLNGGTLSTDITSFKLKEGEEYHIDGDFINFGSVKVEEPKKDGYSFLGWYIDNIKIDKGEYSITNDITIKAEFSPNTYTISFNTNSDNTINDIKVVFDTLYSLPQLEKDGYIFNGWYLDNELVSDGIYKYTKDIILDAKFTPNSFTINYDASGGELSNNKQEIKFGESFTLPTPTKEGYEFSGWYLDNEKIEEGVYKYNKDITLVAQYSPNRYTITFDVNDGEDLDSSTLDVTYDSKFTLPTPVRAGYDFSGWFRGKEEIKSGTYKLTTDIKLVASWTLKTIKITLDSNGGNVNNSILEVKYSKTMTLPTPGRHGHVFEGWFYNDTKVTDGTCLYTEDVTLVAKWKANTYTITYNVNGGNALSKTTETITYGNNFTLPTPTRTGYTFNGWFEGDEKIESGVWDAAKNLSVTAKWTANVYKITYDVVGGEALDSNVQYVTYGEKYTLKTTTKQGYNFRGWYYGENSDIRLEAGTWTKTEDVSVKATWQKKSSGGGGGSTTTIKYTVTFNTDGGNQIASQTVTSGTTIILPTPTKDNFKFDGWYNGETKITTETLKVSSNITLKAKWVQLFTVIFTDGNGNTLQTIKVEAGKTPSFSGDNPTIASDLYNFEFNGWDKALENVTKDVTYNARYTLKSAKTKTLENYEIPNYVNKIGVSAFENCTSATQITISTSVTSIDRQAFYGCSALTSIVIPSGVTTISNFTFYGCFKLSSVTLPETVTTIENNAFQNCKALVSLTIPEGVTSIGIEAFSGCVALTTINLPNTIASIDGFFEGCTSLSTIVIPTSVTKIGSKAFKDCTSLATISIPTSVTSIDSDAFNGCTSLTSVTIPSSVTSIGTYAFDGCTNLSSVTIPNSVTSIGRNAFAMCTSLTSITLPSGITGIEHSTFSGCSGITSITIPSGVTKINDYAFRDCSSLVSITLPTTLTTIGNYVFKSCDQLIKIYYLGNSDAWNSISVGKFEVDLSPYIYIYSENAPQQAGNYWHVENDNPSVWVFCDVVFDTNGGSAVESSKVVSGTVINLPTPTKEDYNFMGWYIGDEKVEGNSITITKNITLKASWKLVDGYTGTDYVVTSFGEEEVGIQSYSGNGGDITIPRIINGKYVTSIQPGAFMGCTSLTSVVIPNTVKYISVYAFTNCYNLKSVTIPSGVNSIGDYAFYGCVSLTSITIPESVTEIRDFAFFATNITSITIPSSVTAIGKGVFSECVYLKSITVDSENEYYDSRDNSNAIIHTSTNTLITGCKNTVIPEGIVCIGDYAYYVCIYMTSIAFPDSVTTIGDYAFGHCNQIAEFNLPVNLETIGDYAFSECSLLSSIIIPDNVETIGKYAFYDCEKLRNVNLSNSLKTIGECAFKRCFLLMSLEIPSSVTQIDDNAFEQCSKLLEVVNRSNLEIVAGASSNGKVAYYARQVINDISLTKYNKTQDGFLLYTYNNDVYLVEYTGEINNVIIPNNVTIICDYAFLNPKSISAVTIPNGVTSINSCAFSGCSSLTNITIPNSVTYIGPYAFQGCSSLEGIDIPSSVTTIGSNAFQNCSSLVSIEIPNGITRLGNYTFDGCTSLKTIIIPSSITIIEKNAFYNCSSLSSVYFCGDSEQYTSLSNTPENGTVYYEYGKEFTITLDTRGGIVGSDSIVVRKYQEFILPVPTKQDSEFLGWYLGDTKVESGIYTYSTDITLVAEYNYTGTDFVTQDLNDGTIEITKYVGNSVEVNIPWKINGKLVTSIGGEAFSSLKTLTSVSIPRSVTNIGNYAFSGCFYLENIVVDEGNSVYDSRNNCNAIIITATNTLIFGCKNTTIPNNVTTIGDYAFLNCSTLTSITIPNSVISIGKMAFFNCQPTNVAIPDSVVSIGDSAFGGCSSLISITIGNGVISIGDSAFYVCSSLTNVTIGENVETIGAKAFEGCSSLASIIIPNSVTNIGNLAFNGCASLQSIEIPDSVISLGVYAFYECTSLESVVIGSGLTSISERTFVNCRSLTTVTIPNSVKSIGFLAFNGCTSLQSIEIPNSVISIGDSAFDGCTLLASVTIGNSVTTIGQGAFVNCKLLASIEIPNSVTSIGNSAFGFCSSLTSIVIPSSITSIDENAFSNCVSMATIYYGGSADQYNNLTNKPSYGKVYYYSENEPTEAGNYWHYVNDVATIWE